MLQMIMTISQIMIISHSLIANTENEDFNIIFKYLLLSVPSSILFAFLNKFDGKYID